MFKAKLAKVRMSCEEVVLLLVWLEEEAVEEAELFEDTLAELVPRMLMMMKRLDDVLLEEEEVFVEEMFAEEALMLTRRRVERSEAFRLITVSSVAFEGKIKVRRPSVRLAWRSEGRWHRSRLALSSRDPTVWKSIERVMFWPTCSACRLQAMRELVWLRLPVTSSVALALELGPGELVAEGDDAGEELGEGLAGQSRPEPMRELTINALPFTATVPPMSEFVTFSTGLDEGKGPWDPAEALAEELSEEPMRKMSKGSVPLRSNVVQLEDVDGEGEAAGEVD
jgi:hypothetical protein